MVVADPFFRVADADASPDSRESRNVLGSQPERMLPHIVRGVRVLHQVHPIEPVLVPKSVPQHDGVQRV